MPQYIKAINYTNVPKNHVFNCFCTGKKLSLLEAIDLGIVTEAEFNHFESINYSQCWYSIKPGDKLKVISFKNWTTLIYTFIIPKAELTNPPTKIQELDEDELDRYIHYFTKNCTYSQG
jgi:hypothetical protein